MGFAPTWLRQVSPPLLHKTTLTTASHLATITRLRKTEAWVLLHRCVGKIQRSRYYEKLLSTFSLQTCSQCNNASPIRKVSAWTLV